MFMNMWNSINMFIYVLKFGLCLINCMCKFVCKVIRFNFFNIFSLFCLWNNMYYDFIEIKCIVVFDLLIILFKSL